MKQMQKAIAFYFCPFLFLARRVLTEHEAKTLSTEAFRHAGGRKKTQKRHIRGVILHRRQNG